MKINFHIRNSYFLCYDYNNEIIPRLDIIFFLDTVYYVQIID